MKECPFCGSNDIICDDRPDGTEVWCNKCEAEGPYASNLGVAERLWNTRKEEIMLKKCPFCGSEEIEFDYNCMRCKDCLTEGPTQMTEEEATELWNKRSVRECQCGEEDDSMHYVIYMSDDGVTVEEFFSEDELLECLHDDWFDDDFQIYEDIGDVMNMCDMPKGTMIVVKGEIVNPLSEEE